MLAGAGRLKTAGKPISEVNTQHDLVRALAALSDDDRAFKVDLAHLLFDDARVLDGDRPTDARMFCDRLARLMRRGLGTNEVIKADRYASDPQGPGLSHGCLNSDTTPRRLTSHSMPIRHVRCRPRPACGTRPLTWRSHPRLYSPFLLPNSVDCYTIPSLRWELMLSLGSWRSAQMRWGKCHGKCEARRPAQEFDRPP
jgi:hypothetical protein